MVLGYSSHEKGIDMSFSEYMDDRASRHFPEDIKSRLGIVNCEEILQVTPAGKRLLSTPEWKSILSGAPLDGESRIEAIVSLHKIITNTLKANDRLKFTSRSDIDPFLNIQRQLSNYEDNVTAPTNQQLLHISGELIKAEQKIVRANPHGYLHLSYNLMVEEKIIADPVLKKGEKGITIERMLADLRAVDTDIPLPFLHPNIAVQKFMQAYPGVNGELYGLVQDKSFQHLNAFTHSKNGRYTHLAFNEHPLLHAKIKHDTIRNSVNHKGPLSDKQSQLMVHLCKANGWSHVKLNAFDNAYRSNRKAEKLFVEFTMAGIKVVDYEPSARALMMLRDREQVLNIRPTQSDPVQAINDNNKQSGGPVNGLGK